jgi:hypothetical protein
MYVLRLSINSAPSDYIRLHMVPEQESATENVEMGSRLLMENLNFGEKEQRGLQDKAESKRTPE